MRRNTWKYALVLISSYVLLMVVIFFAYVGISNNFILSQAKKELVVSTEDIANLFALQIDHDYMRFEQEVEDSIDPLKDINPSSFYVLHSTLLGLGTIDGRDLVIDDQSYTFSSLYFTSDFNQQVAIYSFNDAFQVSQFSDKPYMVFKVGNVVGFFDASTYIDHFFENNELVDLYFVIATDNRIFYTNDEVNEYSYFNDYFREAGNSQNTINDFSATIYSRQSGILQSNAFSGDDYLTYAPIHIRQSMESPIYFTLSFKSENVRQSSSYLTGALWALFLVVFVIYSLSTLLIYRILSTRIEDIQNARMKLYYSKPMIMKIKKDGFITSYNKSFKAFLGNQDIYDNISDFRIKEKIVHENLIEHIERQKPFTVLFTKANETIYIRFIPTRTHGGFLLIGDDVSETEGRYDEFKTLALVNPVTNLPNKNSLLNELKDFFNDEEAFYKKNALVAFDIVSFSKINMLLGKRSGDHFLRLVSDYALESLEGYPAMLFNLEVDRFVVLFRDLDDYAWVTRWIEKLIDIFDKPITIERNLLNVNAKFGVFNIEYDRYEILNPQIAVDNLLLALEHAKENSIKKYFVYDVSLSIIASRHNRMEVDLANAIIKQEFKMVYQPQYDNEQGKIIGFEALIRWDNPRYANDSPLRFIRLAEQNSMIIDIGRIALHETFLAAKELEPFGVEISLNISPVQMLQAGFVNEVISTFEQYDLKKGSICLEITETFLIDSFELVIAKLKLLRNYGFSIHLDDFGTGYSSLQYLKDLPINAIKIDKTFIDSIVDDKHSRAIVHMMSSLAKDTELKVIAEGVENEKQNVLVYKNGCDIIQGYIISKPVSKELAVQLIRDYNIDKTKRVEVPKKDGRKR